MNRDVQEYIGEDNRALLLLKQLRQKFPTEQFELDINDDNTISIVYLNGELLFNDDFQNFRGELFEKMIDMGLYNLTIRQDVYEKFTKVQGYESIENNLDISLFDIDYNGVLDYYLEYYSREIEGKNIEIDVLNEYSLLASSFELLKSEYNYSKKQEYDTNIQVQNKFQNINSEEQKWLPIAA